MLKTKGRMGPAAVIIPARGGTLLLVTLLAWSPVLPAGSVTASAGLTWNVDVVDAAGESGRQPSIAVAGDGTLYVVYRDRDEAGDVVRLATRAAATWTFETIAGPGMFAGDTSLALGYGGRLHVVFYDGLAQTVRYGMRDASGGAWTLGDVDLGSWEGYSALRLDRYDVPHVAYAYANGTLRYAHLSDGFWIRESIDPDTLLARYVALDVDRDGRPHIAYYGRGQLRYATKPGFVWSVEVIDARERVGWFAQILLNRSAQPHVAYYDSIGGALWHGYRDARTWALTKVDGSGDAGWDANLVLDPGGEPQIAYYVRLPGDLRHARREGGSWVVQVVDDEGVSGWEPSLAFDAYGTPFVAYHDWTRAALKVATGRDVLGARTVDASGVTEVAARLHGEVSALGPYREANVSFEWRRQGGAAWTRVEALATGDRAAFEAAVSGLVPATDYEFRAVVEAAGTRAEGRVLPFRTREVVPGDPYPMFFTGLSIALLLAGVVLALWIWFLHPARIRTRGDRRRNGPA